MTAAACGLAPPAKPQAAFRYCFSFGAVVSGWSSVRNGGFLLSDRPGLGLELDEAALARHPYRAGTFPSLWDRGWLTDFHQRK